MLARASRSKHRPVAAYPTCCRCARERTATERRVAALGPVSPISPPTASQPPPSAPLGPFSPVPFSPFSPSARTRARTQTNRALALSKLEDHTNVVAACTEALKIDLVNEKALYRRGVARSKLGLFDLAEADLHEVPCVACVPCLAELCCASCAEQLARGACRGGAPGAEGGGGRTRKGGRTRGAGRQCGWLEAGDGLLAGRGADCGSNRPIRLQASSPPASQQAAFAAGGGHLPRRSLPLACLFACLFACIHNASGCMAARAYLGGGRRAGRC